MTILVDAANCASRALPSVAPGAANTVNGLCAALDNLLVCLEFNRQTGSGTQIPSSVTYNGIALTLRASINDSGHIAGSIWTLANPPTGSSYVLSATYPNQCAVSYIGFVPVQAANNTYGTFATATSSANNNPAVTPTGAGVNDIYIGFAGNNDTTQTNGGSQTNLASGNDISASSINGLCCATGATLPGTGSGAFSWTGTGTSAGTSWVALGVALIAAPPTVTAFNGLFNLVGQDATISTTGTGDFVMLAAPGNYSLTYALPGGGGLSFPAGTGLFSLIPQQATFTPLSATSLISMSLECYDQLNGSINLAWTAAPMPASFNVYVNDVLYQNVTGLLTTVSGLQKETYDHAGHLVASGTYRFKVVPIVFGAEVGQAVQRRVTVNPASIMLTTPMKRLWPFPNTGLD